ncbi:heterokaryon incompatibility protein-domain-containing protein [Microdochium trichocladiopsis]|uniref:Heterokaryon incompatibility protein-domain-containing protein n=1 Tax=Microdochium trichocladiopsis TaxID=1682393 RepID=A0A9P8XVH5_9PEZI|nr:heterokaryon incompatibility protein-domain-containing protein [Microdochium trichocladiopsis]KAH7014503.1 heterokaryon incompatibility protein-domain-containing protein [Microdochium trichocladiopsis]
MRRMLQATGALLNAADSATKSFSELEVVQKSKSAYQEWASVEPFPYEPLATPTTIRLLKLEPSREMQKAQKAGKTLSGDAHDDDDDVHFTMAQAELDRNPQFTALSYTWRQQRSSLGTWTRWGYESLAELLKEKPVHYELPDADEEELRASRKVTCNGRTMKVFENLYEALKQLRRNRPGEWFWIDAVCMNQSDSTELVAQIQIMGRIYQSAQLVVVWLGPFTGLAERGLKTFEELAQSGEPLPENPMYNTAIGATAAEDWKMNSAAMAAYHLTQRSYFKRVWVVQELCLAREVTYLHGKHEISLSTLLAACAWCIDSGSAREDADYVQLILAPYYVSHIQFLPTTLNARNEFAKGNKWTLLEWLQACNGRLASVAKDYVFGGLSLVRVDQLTIDQELQPVTYKTGSALAATTAQPPPGAPPTLVQPKKQSLTPKGLWVKLHPNYEASDAEVFVNASACLMTHAGVEELLRISSRLRDKHRFRDRVRLQPHELKAFSGLPSWVPAIGSWTSRLTVNLVPPGADNPFSACPRAATVDPHSGSASSPSPPSRPAISADGATLALPAAVFDEVASLEYEKDRPLQYTELRKLMRFLATSPSVYDNHAGGDDKNAGPCLLEAVACAMAAGHVAGQPVTPAQAGVWLCESIESKVGELVAETQRGITDDQHIQKGLVTKAQKKGHGIDYLKTAEDDTAARKWRVCTQSIEQGLELVKGAAAELTALRAKYSHLRWPEKPIGVIAREHDLERARLERRNSKEKELEELLEKRSIDTKSSSSIRAALDRAKLRATEAMNDVYDRLNMWEMDCKGSFRRLVSDECRTFEEAYIDALSWRRICLTRQGYVLLAPLWADEGDSIMLLPGVSVPFIFTREAADLQREEARIKERLTHVGSGDGEDLLWTAAKVELDARLIEVQDRLRSGAEQQGGPWVLIGEAYIQGIMQGEAAAGLDYGSIDIV